MFSALFEVKKVKYYEREYERVVKGLKSNTKSVKRGECDRVFFHCDVVSRESCYQGGELLDIVYGSIVKL